MRIVLVSLACAVAAPSLHAQESNEAQDLKKRHPLLAQFDIPTESLPKGCSKPDLQPEDFPIEGIRQGAITTDSRAIAALAEDTRGPKVGAENIEAIYFACYREGNDIGIVGFAFANTQVAKQAYKSLKKRNDDDSRVWRRGKYTIWLWRDIGTTDRCMREMALIIDGILRRYDGKKN
jgi:hypothetical protein